MIDPQPVGRFALINGRVVLPRAVAFDKAVVVEGARIVEVVEADALGAGVHARTSRRRWATWRLFAAGARVERFAARRRAGHRSAS